MFDCYDLAKLLNKNQFWPTHNTQIGTLHVTALITFKHQQVGHWIFFLKLPNVVIMAELHLKKIPSPQKLEKFQEKNHQRNTLPNLMEKFLIN